jgi:molecular chaperone HscB
VRAERTNKTIAALSRAFGKTPQPDVEKAKQLTVELQYLRNLENAAREWRPGQRVEIKH